MSRSRVVVAAVALLLIIGLAITVIGGDSDPSLPPEDVTTEVFIPPMDLTDQEIKKLSQSISQKSRVIVVCERLPETDPPRWPLECFSEEAKTYIAPLGPREFQVRVDKEQFKVKL